MVAAEEEDDEVPGKQITHPLLKQRFDLFIYWYTVYNDQLINSQQV